MPVHGIQVVIDCAEPIRLSEFWATTLGYVVEPPPAGFDTWEQMLEAMHVPRELWGSYSGIVDPDGDGPRVFFQRVPEAKTTKNRVHLDVHVAVPPGEDAWTAVLAHVALLESVGARRVREFDELGAHWMTCLDPEGNEFDVAGVVAGGW